MIELTRPEIYTILGTLAAVITFLSSLIVIWLRSNQETLKKHERRQEDYNQEIKHLTGDMHYLKGQMDGVSSLSRSVLDEISKLKLRTIEEEYKKNSD